MIASAIRRTLPNISTTSSSLSTRPYALDQTRRVSANNSSVIQGWNSRTLTADDESHGVSPLRSRSMVVVCICMKIALHETEPRVATVATPTNTVTSTSPQASSGSPRERVGGPPGRAEMVERTVEPYEEAAMCGLVGDQVAKRGRQMPAVVAMENSLPRGVRLAPNPWGCFGSITAIVVGRLLYRLGHCPAVFVCPMLPEDCGPRRLSGRADLPDRAGQKQHSA